MDNYKIKVNDEAVFAEVVALCEQISGKSFPYPNISCDPDLWIFIGPEGAFGWSLDLDHSWSGLDLKELTLPQLRDLVVLKRNDVKDSNCTYRLAAEEKNYAGYLDSNDWMHIFKDGGWQAYVPVVSEELKAFYLNSKAKDPALISGAEAHQALLAGKNVQYSGYGEQYWDTALNCNIGVFLNHEKFPDFKFRIVPRTIKVELELPRPFEPEEDCHVYILDDGKTDGYRRYSYEVHGDKGNTFIGIWRTEEEIKQVVEQLRKIRGTNS
ncbi:hypothetical protein PXZ69_06345 [Acinetobacter baumannii]|uniref:hypothetical protein n=1 Tax=Acinetobacter baumannii TaxID=470 RepID=UPI002F410C05